MLEMLVLGGLSYLIAAPIAKNLGDDRAPGPAPASPACSPQGSVAPVDAGIPADCSRIPGFRQMFTMQDGSIFSPMVNPPHAILEFHTGGEWLYGKVDTGATNMVLSHADARKIGINISRLRYDSEANTAGGIRKTAMLIIPDMTIGAFSVKNVAGSLLKDDVLTETLVGQSFLRRIPRGVRMIEEGILLYP
jgi:clan AA aspartic protease (TIGR02281 family)